MAERRLVLPLLQLGLPDRFIDHGEQGQLLAIEGLDADGITAAIRERFVGLAPLAEPRLVAQRAAG
jgi:1-deoxy-D-xylulose-5-phosphate synthase